MNKKDTNLKEALGVVKAPLSTVSAPVMFEVGLAMFEGAVKYRRHNYRVSGIKSSVYYDATLRHLAEWWEGEDIDKDSGLHNITKAIACLVVVRDAQIHGVENDDRPPKSPDGWLQEYHKKVGELLAKYPNPEDPFTELNK